MTKAHPPLRVLVQDPETQKFLMWQGGWTESAADAFDFQTTASALAFCRAGKLEPVRTILHLGDSYRCLVFSAGL